MTAFWSSSGRTASPAGSCAPRPIKGWRSWVAESSPRQVLEDFVRVLEAREGEVGELLAAARRMADGLVGLKSAVAAVLPRVVTGRVSCEPRPFGSGQPAPLPNGRGSYLSPHNAETPTMTATLDAPTAVAVADPSDDLAGVVLAHLADWAASAAVGQDCPLPDLFRSLTLREHPPTIGTFHDCLRQLHAAGQVYLHPWTGPLYALPEPAYALLAGHNVAYYASTRN